MNYHFQVVKYTFYPFNKFTSTYIYQNTEKK